MNQLSTRFAKLDDLPVLSGIWYDKAVLLAQQDTRFQLAPDARAVWESALAVWLEDPKYAVIVVEDDRALSGYVVGHVQWMLPGIQPAQLGAILDLAVELHDYHPRAARALVEALRHWFSGQGVDQVIVQVHRQSAIEQAFWRSMGASRWMEWMWIRS